MCNKIILKKILLIFFSLSFYAQENAKTDFGTIENIEGFNSKYVEARNIDVWLPKNYNSNKKYPVIYMNNGKMLFDKNISWNDNVLELDSIAQKLIDEKIIKEVIIVGIHNIQITLHADYTPQKAYETMSVDEKNDIKNQLKQLGRVTNDFTPNGDNYLKFLTEELKPYIDKKYSTLTDKKNTFIGGSCLGSLISIYALCEYPEVFGGMIGMSTHWPYAFLPENHMWNALQIYFQSKISKANEHKIYLDYGNTDLDIIYPGLQKKIDDIILKKGYDKKHYLSLFFDGDGHSEVYWKNRIHFGLEFLLKN